MQAKLPETGIPVSGYFCKEGNRYVNYNLKQPANNCKREMENVETKEKDIVVVQSMHHSTAEYFQCLVTYEGI